LKTDDGFILLETLLALAMFSLIAVGALQLIQPISGLISQPPPTTHADLVLKLREDPNLYETDSRLRLVEEVRFDETDLWRVYIFTPEGSQNGFEFPIYYPKGLP